MFIDMFMYIELRQPPVDHRAPAPSRSPLSHKKSAGGVVVVLLLLVVSSTVRRRYRISWHSSPGTSRFFWVVQNIAGHSVL